MANRKVKSKKERAIALFNKGCDHGKTRGEILKDLQSKLEMTEACAKNYYQKLAAGIWM